MLAVLLGALVATPALATSPPVLIEREETEDSERDLQTTERFELATEAREVSSESSSLQVGVSVAASYGPVSLSSNLDYQTSSSSESSFSEAREISREVVDKAVNRITKRVREAAKLLP